MKGKVWDTILKVIIAVASAVLGALGDSSMNLQFFNKQGSFSYISDFLADFLLEKILITT